ncbi:alpha/beta fold hydrolase [Burkholderia alba]|uniref:alpha/beta fold hydrolase n=1 Tax=Burkholderia alba TaxID=2683677 RepID=UPI002B05AF8D|nr:alpha/beta fold hydrolase [Burkholderia alba]
MADPVYPHPSRRRLLGALAALPPVLALGGLAACRDDAPAHPAAPVADRQVAVAPDVSLHVRDWGRTGNRDVIVLLGGLGSNAFYFDGMAAALASRWRVLAVSRRGFGQSGKPLPDATHRYDTDTLVQDLKTVLDALNVSRMVLAGHSIAGNELTRFAGLHPDRVRGLAYLDTSFDYTLPDPVIPGLPDNNPAFRQPDPTDADRASISAAIAYARRTTKSWSAPQEANLRDMLAVGPDGRLSLNTPPIVFETFQNTAHAFSPDYTAVHAPALVIAALPHDAPDLYPWLPARPDPQTAADLVTMIRVLRHYRLLDMERLAKAVPTRRQIIFDRSAHETFIIEHEADIVREINAIRL